MSSGDRIQGTVKWFSNKKGYGFITPSDQEEDIFVHQSCIHSDGYRTLSEGWIVEFDVVTDETGKIKADHVTAPGGGPCTGPRKRAPRHGNHNHEASENDVSSRTKKTLKPRQEWWHGHLSDTVKESMSHKSVQMHSGTVDVSLEGYRIKLGTLGYTSMAHADGILAEGTFTSQEDGLVLFEWQHAIQFENGEWKPYATDSIVKSLNLSNDAVGAVGSDETAATLWGDEPTDPKVALETNGFQMRRVVLTARGARGGGTRN